MSKQSRKDKKLLKKIRKMKCGDELRIHDYDIVCVDEQFYLLIHPNNGIFEKHFNEISEWIIVGGELDF